MNACLIQHDKIHLVAALMKLHTFPSRMHLLGFAFPFFLTAFLLCVFLLGLFGGSCIQCHWKSALRAESHH